MLRYGEESAPPWPRPPTLGAGSPAPPLTTPSAPPPHTVLTHRAGHLPLLLDARAEQVGPRTQQTFAHSFLLNE